VPRYFFHTAIGDDVITDNEGVELRDADHAWEVARSTIEASLSETTEQARLMTAILVVTDDTGEIFLEFPFAEVVTPPSETDKTRH
jgi:hypothetical protein